MTTTEAVRVFWSQLLSRQRVQAWPVFEPVPLSPAEEQFLSVRESARAWLDQVELEANRVLSEVWCRSAGLPSR